MNKILRIKLTLKYIIKNIFTPIFLIVWLLLLSACTINNTVELGQEKSQWDFDHNIQFKQTQLDQRNYHIEVIPNNQVDFDRLSAFLLRHSYLVCGGYGYQLTLITGIKSVDHLRESPNLIMKNLTAKLSCPLPAKIKS